MYVPGPDGLYYSVAHLLPVAMTRKVIKDFTFSDGTTIPTGNLVTIPEASIHFDAVRSLYFPYFLLLDTCATG